MSESEIKAAIVSASGIGYARSEDIPRFFVEASSLDADLAAEPSNALHLREFRRTLSLFGLASGMLRRFRQLILATREALH